MAITADYVRQVFKGLEDGDGAEFFKYVSDDVDWTVEGTRPLAGHYRSKANFVAGTFAKLGKVLPKGAQLHVEHLLVKDDQAVVELHSLATEKTECDSITGIAGSLALPGTRSSRSEPISIQTFVRHRLR
jgi:ketosteroid isomerase-like protein